MASLLNSVNVSDGESDTNIDNKHITVKSVGSQLAKLAQESFKHPINEGCEKIDLFIDMSARVVRCAKTVLFDSKQSSTLPTEPQPNTDNVTSLVPILEKEKEKSDPLTVTDGLVELCSPATKFRDLINNTKQQQSKKNLIPSKVYPIQHSPDWYVNSFETFFKKFEKTFSAHRSSQEAKLALNLRKTNEFIQDKLLVNVMCTEGDKPRTLRLPSNKSDPACTVQYVNVSDDESHHHTPSLPPRKTARMRCPSTPQGRKKKAYQIENSFNQLLSQSEPNLAAPPSSPAGTDTGFSN